MMKSNTPKGKNQWDAFLIGPGGNSFAPDMFDARAMVIQYRFWLIQMILLLFLVMNVVFLGMGGSFLVKGYGWFHVPSLVFGACFGSFLAFEILYWRTQKYYLMRRQPEPDWIKVLVITVEVSLPMLGILMQWLYIPLADCVGLNFIINHIPFMVLSMLHLRFWMCFYAGLVAILVRGGLLVLLKLEGGEFQARSIWAFWFLLLAGLMMGVVALLMRRMVESILRNSAERVRVQDTFGRFVSRDVAQKLMEKPVSLGGESMDACVMFLDIRNFTQRSSKMTPEAVVGFLNKLFAFTVAEVEKSGGMVNKFLGDGFMAVFGTPLPLQNPSRSAVECARNIFSHLHLFNSNNSLDPVELGIGINCGPLVSGVVGTPERKEFTVIGDTVNMASRIEGLNKELGSTLLISPDVYDNLGRDFQTHFEAVPNVCVKGKDEPFTVYRARKA